MVIHETVGVGLDTERVLKIAKQGQKVGTLGICRVDHTSSRPAVHNMISGALVFDSKRFDPFFLFSRPSDLTTRHITDFGAAHRSCNEIRARTASADRDLLHGP